MHRDKGKNPEERNKDMTTTFADFDREYTAFAIKHNKKAERTEYTQMKDGVIHKMVAWTDGATWWEITDTNYSEEVEIEVRGIKTKVTVQLRKTEYWSTEDSKSKYFYERA